MSDDLTDYERDLEFLNNEMKKWWKIPNEKQIDIFCDMVARMVVDDEYTEADARKLAFDRVNRML